MKRIPITIPFEDDELLTSWEIRMSKANLYRTRADFSKVWSNGQLLTRDSFGFSRKLLLGSHFYENQSLVYEQHSLYPFFAPFLNKQRQESILYSQRLRYDKGSPNFKLGGDVSVYKYCPKCVEEDPRIYLHRAHQLPGVNVCHKHCCKLSTLKKSYTGTEMLDIPFDEEPNYNVPSSDIFYAIFMKDFMDNAFDMDIKDLYNMIDVRLKELDIKTSKDVNKYFKSKGLSISRANAANIVSKNKVLTGKFLMENVITIFDNIFDFKRIYEDVVLSKDIPTDIPDEIKNEGYELISKYKRNLLEIRHKDCGNSFLITEHGLLNIGLRCPDCVKLTNENLYKKMFNSVTDSNFTLLSPFVSRGEDVLIKHSCGLKFKSNPLDFYLLEKGCPKCSGKLTLKEAQEKVDAVDPSWKVLNYDAIDRKATFMHTPCGNKVDRRFTDFLRKKMTCPVCKEKNVKESRHQDFIQRLKDLVGDEYSLVGNYNTLKSKVKLKHNLCGKTHTYPAFQFIKGRRCPFCEGELIDDDVKDYVYKKTKGQLEILEFLYKSNVIVKDNNFADKYNNTFEIPKELLIQELHRTTKSKILNVDTKTDIDKPLSGAGKCLRLIKEKYKGKPFTKTEILKDLGLEDNCYYSHYIYSLRDNGYIENIGADRFRLVPQS